ncbi:Auxin efflux carrier [Ostreococcus tauri]|uniref:Auxin efflux carrier n=1 Tax=Ostreococcus tauri TaxID=70448 RepID=Q014U4_OSTTA|nr:Auxin efflux carrier [Ostreococcus tauri]CAL54585.1 Auxin efflux carrier [Ostreococcus tauri]|eukprot:XP_003080418.1 Auxin efflux carrier [Ostreococcus tauri]
MVSAGAQIFFAAVRAVAEVFVVGAIGVHTARRGLMDKRLQRALARFNGSFFLPALLWTSLSRSVTIERLREMWLLPLASMVHVIIGLGLGLLVVRGCGVKAGFRTVATMSAAFGNSLALPVVVTRAITKNPRIGNLTFTAEDGDRCVLYLSAYVVMLSASMWSLGPWLFRRRIAAKVSRDGYQSESEGGPEASVAERGGDLESIARTRSFAQRTLDFAKVFFNPNVASCVVGVLTGICTPVRDILFKPGRALSWIGGAAQLLADAAIPTVLLVIGASLARGPDYSLADRKTALAVVGVRFVIIPLLSIGVYFALKDANGISPSTSDGSTDKIFWLCFLAVSTTPTANNLMLQAQMYHPDDDAAAGVGTLLFWQYLVCPVILTAYYSWYLTLIDR